MAGTASSPYARSIPAICTGSFRRKGRKASAWSDSRSAELGKSAVCARFFSVVLPLRKVAKQAARPARPIQITVPHDANAVHPDAVNADRVGGQRSEEHTSELQSQFHLVCRLLLEKKKK